MTAVSTSTLLDVVNLVLMDVGERQVTALISPAAKKASTYVKESLSELQHLHDWEWLHSVVTPASWVLDTAQLSNVQRIKYVSWSGLATTTQWARLTYVDSEIFDSTVAQVAYDSIASPATRPLFWTLPDYNTVRVNPYPTDAAGQSRIKVYVVQTMVPPTTTTGVFPVPEFIIPLLHKLATAKMYQHHLSDMGGYQTSTQEFQIMLNQLRVRQAKSPSGGQLNMFKRSRRYP